MIEWLKPKFEQSFPAIERIPNQFHKYLMQHHTNFNLKAYNTFALDVNTKNFYAFDSESELIKFFNQANIIPNPVLILGGGSNILFTKDFNGSIIKMNNSDAVVLSETRTDVVVKADAGMVWDEFVNYCISRNFYGTENLSYIPGTVGASPVQNIGAYGTEAKDIIEQVHAVQINTGTKKIFSNQDCKFEYRNSIFKTELKNKYIITAVAFRLQKDGKLNTNYGSIGEEASKYKELNLSIFRDIIVDIRKNKLPDPEKIPNAGSFFKNPVISESKHLSLLKKYPKLVSYKAGDKKIKLAAGQLIDLSGFKGFKTETCGVHKNQALVLLNHNNASGKEILSLSQKIRNSVHKNFGIELSPEVNII
ncbi:MAG: UDP-N-acetylmuramate dehydrogenase [Bacteroidota bacterium]|nr:UDP-N-acetylmuramate dehydrogenase [Bacteroidota bacterium]